MKLFHLFKNPLFMMLCAYLGLMATPSVSHAYPAPVGFIDSAANGAISGWAADTYIPNEPVAVHIYIDQPAGYNGRNDGFAGAVSTSIYRPDVEIYLRTATGNPSINGVYGFSFSIPDKYYDGRAHVVWAYGVSRLEHVWMLSRSGIQFTNPAAQGWIESVSNGQVNGWAANTYAPNNAVRVDFISTNRLVIMARMMDLQDL